MLDLNRLARALQDALLKVKLQCAEPLSEKIEYEAGRRIGRVQGVQIALEVINDLINEDEKKETLL